MSAERYSFDVVIHARPAAVRPGPTFALRGLDLPTLAVSPTELTGFERTFEEVAADLERFERLYFEPDGSIVWVSSQADRPWQLDGMLYDRAGRVLHLELKGSCPPEAVEQVATVLGRPASGLVFQLTREALYLDEAAFRRYAAAT